MKRRKQTDAETKREGGVVSVAVARSRSVVALTEEDNRLWQQIARTVDPIKRRGQKHTQLRAVKVRAAPRFLSAAPRQPVIDTARVLQQREKAQNNRALCLVDVRKQTSPGNFPVNLNNFDVGAYRRLVRGQMPIDARLDLHGYTQSEAHDTLLYFIRTAQARGLRCVLIITGRGRSLGSEGILQRRLPHWLSAAPFRIYIAGVAYAAREHGGEGAFYVRLRRVRN